MTVEDYSRDLIEELIPTIFDRTYAWGMTNDAAPDPQMPRAATPKNRANTLWAHLADIRRAYDNAPLSLREKRAVVLCGALDYGRREAGEVLGLSKSSMQSAWDSAITKLYNFLNGTPEWPGDELAAAA